MNEKKTSKESKENHSSILEALKEMNKEDIEKAYYFLKLYYEVSEQLEKLEIDHEFKRKMVINDLLKYNPHALLLELEITDKGHKFFHEYEEKYVKDLQRKKRFTYIGGATQSDIEKFKKEKEITDDLLYRFLKFHLGVIKSTGAPYLRELVAEDYLIDKEGLPYKQAAKLIEDLVKKGILEYDQFGAFPGTGVTEKGKKFFEELKKKLFPSSK